MDWHAPPSGEWQPTTRRFRGPRGGKANASWHTGLHAAKALGEVALKEYVKYNPKPKNQREVWEEAWNAAKAMGEEAEFEFLVKYPAPP